MMNKKGDIGEGVFLIIGLFILGLIFVFSYLIFSNINTAFQESSTVSDEAKTMTNNVMGRYATIFDNAFAFIMIGLFAGVLILAWFIRSHPALFWLMVPILAIIIFFGAIYANIFVEFTDMPDVATAAAEFPITTFIFNNFVYVVTAMVLLISLALFAKTGDQRL